jgi:hypothetical protein
VRIRLQRDAIEAMGNALHDTGADEHGETVDQPDGGREHDGR